ncbi:ABC transporter permease subunit [Amorphoplanes digitatis]|uniref:ABC-type transport system involved in multi-copper enzyme maturation permease subunit n=1 Tax=Actinoplanes digitatis TaxID=1868 RepID=A0A7W7MRW4_9ACTN|nr:ABC transporter permease subunit [Actinoplanes digitatis]MBB4764723.1 ABC-type transport system involved in multi-copper enzyme maturation permease subunit [Actinoplanes digitatis]BFE74277.1 ABC transporter permease [Actinoplanes digitatis]GID91324.1 ABC transporter permease [Actinoplanes digitatis]
MNGYGFRHAARMERIKLGSLRSTWWLAIAAVAAMAATGAGVGLGYRSHTPVATAAQILNNSLGGAILAQLLLGALGVLAVTGEYGSGMIRSTFAAVPRRRTVLLAKAAVCGGAALAVGLVASLAAYLGGQLAIRGTAIPAAHLGDPAILRAVVLTGVYLGATALIGVGIGTIVRHSGAAIGTLFALTFVPMIVVGLFGESGIQVGRFVPLLMLLNSIAVTAPIPGLFSGWISALLMCGYAAVVILFGGVLLRHRDA